MIITRFRVTKERLSLREGYDRLVEFLNNFQHASNVEAWYRHASYVEERKTGWIPLANEDAYLRRTAREMASEARKWNESSPAFKALITSTPDEASYGRPGSLLITFGPAYGLVEITLLADYLPELDTFSYVKGIYESACTHLPVTFGCCEYTRPSAPDGSRGETYYGVDHRVFPHREFLGWMGFVDRQLTPEDIPEADELIAIPNKGTVIVSVADNFNVHNSEHLEKAKRVEMRVVDLDALPVIDSRFK